MRIILRIAAAIGSGLQYLMCRVFTPSMHTDDIGSAYGTTGDSGRTRGKATHIGVRIRARLTTSASDPAAIGSNVTSSSWRTIAKSFVSKTAIGITSRLRHGNPQLYPSATVTAIAGIDERTTEQVKASASDPDTSGTDGNDDIARAWALTIPDKLDDVAMRQLLNPSGDFYVTAAEPRVLATV